MTVSSNTFPLVIARFMLACPFLVASVTTLVLLQDTATAGYVTEQNIALISTLGDLGKQVPQMLYLLPVTLLTQQFWKEEHISLGLQQDALANFLKASGAGYFTPTGTRNFLEF
ncbi:hypothetical protein Vretifemale_14990 [Volvox reticuliferus]|uniref:Uncharacterized protein n=1 Tax=Volvox reticuliferus TaxID=1737510 RepID=A0A8J4CR62_9CHLO|nr:hypothetical protein Vretifemale_14990 [Volvox reticuliferus]